MNQQLAELVGLGHVSEDQETKEIFQRPLIVILASQTIEENLSKHYSDCYLRLHLM